jgi:surface polysaccharide O-acyltransferase-like enzyme
MLEFILKHRPPKNSSEPTQLKISFDGGTMTSGKRIQQEIGTFQVMNDLTFQELKSHTTAHQWIIYIGPEEYEEMIQELADSLPVLQKWIDNKEVSNFLFLLVFHYLTNSLICQITFNGVKYKIDIFLVCDMKCLVRILGLYDVLAWLSVEMLLVPL